MANPIILAGKLNVKRTALSELETELETLIAEREEIEGRIDGIENYIKQSDIDKQSKLHQDDTLE